MLLRNNRNQIYVMLSKSCKFLWNHWCVGLQSQRILLSVMFSVWQCDWKAQRVHGTISHHIYTWHKGRWELQSAQPFFAFPAVSLLVSHWGILKWATLCWNAILCRLAAISTSQWCATNLVGLSFQRPHLFWNLMRSNFLTLINQPKASLALPTPFSSDSSKTGHHSGVCLYSNSLWPFWLCFVHCDYLFFVLAKPGSGDMVEMLMISSSKSGDISSVLND